MQGLGERMNHSGLSSPLIMRVVAHDFCLSEDHRSMRPKASIKLLTALQLTHVNKLENELSSSKESAICHDKWKRSEANDYNA